MLAYLHWGRQQTEAQIDKMQQKVHFTPGAEALLPAPVLAGALVLVVGHLMFGRGILRLGAGAAWSSLLLGGLLGLGWFIIKPPKEH